MSGGSMDYVAWKIRDAARYIQRELANAELRRKSGRFFDVSKYYQKEYPDVDYLKSPEALMDAVIKRLQDALICVRKASIYAERVEWLTSCDDGYESFCIRLDKELIECEEHGGVEWPTTQTLARYVSTAQKKPDLGSTRRRQACGSVSAESAMNRNRVRTYTTTGCR